MGIDQSYFAPLASGIRPSVSWLDQTRSEVDQVLRRQSLKQPVFFHNTLEPRSDRVTSRLQPLAHSLKTGDTSPDYRAFLQPLRCKIDRNSINCPSVVAAQPKSSA